MIRRYSILALFTLGMLGCDDKPQIPTDFELPGPAMQNALSEKPRPTTQELSVTKEERLSILPLTVTVPQSWNVTTDLGQTVLKGFTPNGEARIHLATRPKLAEDALDRLLDGAKREAAKPEEQARYKFFDIREQNGLRVLEQQKVGPTDPTLGTPFTWTVWFCEKKGDTYEVYELSVSDLSWEDFQKEQAFLRPIILSAKPSGN